jgi:glutathione S-transferase
MLAGPINPSGPMQKLASSAWPNLLDDDDAPPPSTPERRDCVRWLYFAVTRLQPSVLEAFLARDDAPAFESARKTFLAHVREVERALEGRLHLLGDRPTPADAKMGAVLAWAQSLGLIGGEGKLAQYVKRCLA